MNLNFFHKRIIILFLVSTFQILLALLIDAFKPTNFKVQTWSIFTSTISVAIFFNLPLFYLCKMTELTSMTH